MGQNVKIGFGGILGYRLHPGTIASFLQTFRPLCIFKVVFSDSSLSPNHLFLFCLLWLISACADRTALPTLYQFL